MASSRANEIKEALLAEIWRGHYRREQRLPAERELANIYGASRDTVRRALGDLERLGVVAKRGTSGTYVVSESAESLENGSPASTRTQAPSPASWRSNFRPYERVLEEGHGGPSLFDSQWSEDEVSLGTLVMSEPLALVSAPPHVADGLGLPRHALVLRRYQVWNVYTSGRHISECYYPGDQFVDLLREGLDETGFDRWLNAHYDPRLRQVEQTVDFRLPTPQEQFYLHVSRMTPLAVERYRIWAGGVTELRYAIMRATDAELRFYGDNGGTTPVREQ